MDQEIKKEKSLLEKFAPIILIVALGFLVWFGLSKVNFGGGSVTINTGSSSTEKTTSIQIDIDFLNSEAFTSLKFIPDPAVFSPATGVIPSGKDDPFSPVK